MQTLHEENFILRSALSVSNVRWAANCASTSAASAASTATAASRSLPIFTDHIGNVTIFPSLVRKFDHFHFFPLSPPQ